MHIYAFGSVCRGDITPGSDVDLLAITESHDARFDLATYSIYSYARVHELWQEGNPFAWHLSLESKLLFSEDATDFLRGLGPPQPYRHVVADCEKFARLFGAASQALRVGTNSVVFELSSIFLAIRNIATCYSLGLMERPDFSRRSALRLGSDSLVTDPVVFDALERARVLSTRGVGTAPDEEDLLRISGSLEMVESWIHRLCARARMHERVQQ